VPPAESVETQNSSSRRLPCFWPSPRARTTQTGGTHNFGTVLKLTPTTNGKWTETVLHSFNGKDGNDPTCPLVFDSAGDLYGTTISGGAKGFGTVFKLIPGSNGRWTEVLLHSFNGNDGDQPFGGLILDGTGGLYGTTVEGGDLNSETCLEVGCGVVFKLTQDANGNWTETVLQRVQRLDGRVLPRSRTYFRRSRKPVQYDVVG
jgi:uncharacterized repeat protein (TIGR03803 family)